jgi:hypothetical protein
MFEIIVDEIIMRLVFIVVRSVDVCRIVYPQNSVGMLALSRLYLCAMSNGQHLVPIMVAYRSFGCSRWGAHMIHYSRFENLNFCIIVYPQVYSLDLGSVFVPCRTNIWFQLWWRIGVLVVQGGTHI